MKYKAKVEYTGDRDDNYNRFCNLTVQINGKSIIIKGLNYTDEHEYWFYPKNKVELDIFLS